MMITLFASMTPRRPGVLPHPRIALAHIAVRPTTIAEAVRPSRTAKNATFRRSFLQAMIQTGFGPGAMVQQRSWRGSTMIIRVITSLDWANITFWGYSNHYFEARKPSLVGQSVRAWQVDDLRFPRLQDGVIKKSEYTPDIVVRASEEAIRRAMPAGWLDGAGDTKAVFSNKRGLFHSIKHSQLDLSQWEDKVPGL
jgi:hypothetical protein